MEPRDVDSIEPVREGVLVECRSIFGGTGTLVDGRAEIKASPGMTAIVDGRGDVVCTCPTTEKADMLAYILNARYAQWLANR